MLPFSYNHFRRPRGWNTGRGHGRRAVRRPGGGPATARTRERRARRGAAANEAMGALRFELGTRVTRVWFRRRRVPVLWVHAAGVAPSWPAGSWEARLWAVAARRARRRTPDADTLFRAAIPSDTRPEVSAVTALCIPLCARGVLTIAREPWALQWRADQGKPVLALTPGGATRLDEAPDPALATLAERCARERPAVWAALSAAVARSFDANVVSSRRRRRPRRRDHRSLVDRRRRTRARPLDVAGRRRGDCWSCAAGWRERRSSSLTLGMAVGERVHVVGHASSMRARSPKRRDTSRRTWAVSLGESARSGRTRPAC